jgi:hypothetical protein
MLIALGYGTPPGNFGVAGPPIARLAEIPQTSQFLGIDGIEGPVNDFANAVDIRTPLEMVTCGLRVGTISPHRQEQCDASDHPIIFCHTILLR